MSITDSAASYRQIQQAVIRVLERRDACQLVELQQALGNEYTTDKLRSALDGLRIERKISSDRDGAGRVFYSVRKGKPLPAAVQLARATTDQIVGKNPQRAESGSAAPAIRPGPATEGGAAPVPPAPEREATQAIVRRVLAEHPKGKSSQDIATLGGRPITQVYSAMTLLKKKGVVVGTPGTDPVVWRLTNIDQEPAAPAPARRVSRLDEKTKLLERLQPLVNLYYAELLGEIHNDLTGVPA